MVRPITLFVRGSAGVPVVVVDGDDTILDVLREILLRMARKSRWAGSAWPAHREAAFYVTHNGRPLDLDGLVGDILPHEATVEVRMRMSARLEEEEALWLQQLSWLEDEHRRGLVKLAQAHGWSPYHLRHWGLPFAESLSANLSMSRILLGACDCGEGTLAIRGRKWAWRTALGHRLPGLGYAHLSFRTTDVEALELSGYALRVILRPRPSSIQVTTSSPSLLQDRFVHPIGTVAAELESAAAATAVTAAAAAAASDAAAAAAARFATVGPSPAARNAAVRVAEASSQAAELAAALAAQSEADASDAAKAAEKPRPELLLVCAGKSELRTLLYLLGPMLRFVECRQTVGLLLECTVKVVEGRVLHGPFADALKVKDLRNTFPSTTLKERALATPKPWGAYRAEAPLLPSEPFSHAHHTVEGWLGAVPRSLKLDALRSLPPFRLLELADTLVAHVLAYLDPRSLGSLASVCRALGVVHVHEAAAVRAARQAAPRELVERSSPVSPAEGGSIRGGWVGLRALWEWEVQKEVDTLLVDIEEDFRSGESEDEDEDEEGGGEDEEDEEDEEDDDEDDDEDDEDDEDADEAQDEDEDEVDEEGSASDEELDGETTEEEGEEYVF